MTIKTMARQWQTSSLGIFTILAAVAGAINKGAMDPEMVALFTTGIGLICAKDGDKTGSE